MKKILLIFMIGFSLVGNSQSYKDHTWYYGGIQIMNGHYSGISPVYSADSYHLLNYPTIKGEFFASNSWMRFDISGFFYWAMTLSTNKTGTIPAPNVVTTSDRSMFQVQDRTGWEFMLTKLKNDKNGGFGFQFGARRFSVENWGYNDGEYYILDNGPYRNYKTLGSTFNIGLNYNHFGNIGNFVDYRAGIVINGLAGIYKFGANVYPEVQVIAHIWRIGIVARASYEYTFLYAPTIGLKESGKIHNAEPAKKSANIHGLRYEIGFAIDLQRNH